MLVLSISTAAHRGSTGALEVGDGSQGVALPALRQRLSCLTPRQRQVLELLKAGLTNKAIARRMDITIHTVKAHRMGVMSRMHADSFAELIGMVQGLSKEHDTAVPDSNNLPSVTIVGFQSRLRQALLRYLSANHFATIGLADGMQLDAAWAHEPTDIAIVEPELDSGREDGWHIAKRILKRHTIGVILLSTRGKKFDRIKGLQMGADACFTTPVNMKELRAVLINLGLRLHHV